MLSFLDKEEDEEDAKDNNDDDDGEDDDDDDGKFTKSVGDSFHSVFANYFRIKMVTEINQISFF